MKSKIISTIVIVILMSTYFINVSLAAPTQSEIDALKREQQNAIAQKNAISEEKANEKKSLEELNDELDTLNNEIMNLQNQLDTLNNSISEKESEIEVKQAELDEKQELLKKRLVAMYKTGGIKYLDVLLGATSYADMLASFDALERIADADTKLINKVTDEKRELEKIKSELEEEKAKVDSVKAEKDAKNVELKAKQKEKENRIASLSAEEQEKEKLIEKYRAEIQKGEQEIQAEIERNKNANKGQSTVVGSIDNSSGTLGWPLPSSYARYSYITSYFGPRVRPTAGASTNHGAIDIGVSYQPVYASESGIVVTSGTVSGYGNFIMIWHNGKGQLYTAYAHLSTRYVSAGQTVVRGQQIAVSGNTGVTTGPHLHFEVRVGGSGSGNRVDPLNYVIVS